MKHYSIQDSQKNKTISITLNEDLSNIVTQAEKDFDVSKRYIFDSWYHIWRDGFKQYYMDKSDRAAKLKDPTQSNFCMGTVRKNIDALSSTVTETKINIQATPITTFAQGKEDTVEKLLNYIAEQNKFHVKSQTSLRKGLITGTFAFRQTFGSEAKTIDTIQFVNGALKSVPIEIEKSNIPISEVCDIFTLFPDPYDSELRYVFERKVVSAKTFMNSFWKLINSPLNKSPMKGEDILKLLPVNQNGADFLDYGNVRQQIFIQKNRMFEQDDAFLQNTIGSSPYISTSSNTDTFDTNHQVTENMIEYVLGTYEDRIVLFANKYPVYIGENPYGFINYVITPATETDCRFGESIALMLGPIAEIDDMIVNNTVDSVRATMNPTFEIQK